MRMYRATQPTTPGVLERVFVLVGDSCARAPRRAAAQRRNRTPAIAATLAAGELAPGNRKLNKLRGCDGTRKKLEWKESAAVK